MSGITFQDQNKVRELISYHLRFRGMASLRKIAAYIKEESGLEPAPSTIARLIRERGYEYKGDGWKRQK